jgi:hypothetical protein
VLEGWCGQLSAPMITVLNNLEMDTSHFFTDLTSKADTEISKLYEEAEGALFGAAGPLPQPRLR